MCIYVTYFNRKLECKFFVVSNLFPSPLSRRCSLWGNAAVMELRDTLRWSYSKELVYTYFANKEMRKEL